MTKRWWAVAIVVSGMIAGCGGDPVTSLQTRTDGTLAFVCQRCPAVAGYATSAECSAEAELMVYSEASLECQREAYRMYPDDLAPYYSCANRALANYDACVRRIIGEACPPSSADGMACIEALSTDFEACPPPTGEGAVAVTPCFGM